MHFPSCHGPPHDPGHNIVAHRGVVLEALGGGGIRLIVGFQPLMVITDTRPGIKFIRLLLSITSSGLSVEKQAKGNSRDHVHTCRSCKVLPIL